VMQRTTFSFLTSFFLIVKWLFTMRHTLLFIC